MLLFSLLRLFISFVGLIRDPWNDSDSASCGPKFKEQQLHIDTVVNINNNTSGLTEKKNLQPNSILATRCRVIPQAACPPRLLTQANFVQRANQTAKFQPRRSYKGARIV